MTNRFLIVLAAIVMTLGTFSGTIGVLTFDPGHAEVA